VAAAGAAVALEGGRMAQVGIGLAAVGGETVNSVRAEQALRGREPSEQAFAEAGALAAEDCAPVTDGRGTTAYKRHLAGELTIRALRRAVERARQAAQAAPAL
jgi:carbon-monoxide dehydrogenase medium subunit